jgi:hypothetical protein
MTAEPAVTLGVDGEAPMPCDGCGHPEDQGAAAACQPVCMSAAHALLPDGPRPVRVFGPAQERVPEPGLPTGRTIPPEPDPPRRLTFA